MKTKRPTPKKLPSGAWRCQVMVDGKRISVTEDTAKLAQAKAMAIQAGLMEKQEEQKKALSLSEAIDEYINMKSATLSPSTLRGYQTVQKNRLQSIMQKNVYTLTKKDVQLAVNEDAKSVSAKTVYNSYGLVRPVLKEYGIDVSGVNLPQRVKPNKKYMQPEEISKFLLAIQGDLCEVPILMAICLGLRRSEIIGLCGDCVDAKNGTVTIRRTVVPDRHGRMVLKTGAKNASSQRTISCPDFIMDKLVPMIPPNPKAPIFPFHPDTLRKHVHRVCAAAGITDTGVHGLRHTNAAVMKFLQIDDAHAMQRGGWTNEATYKQTYSYVFSSVADSADQKINDFFQGFAHEFAHKKAK